ncbi:MAG: trypsin-like peptidase domain-containing protein [Gammaproteobacteria bacterium]
MKIRNFIVYLAQGLVVGLVGGFIFILFSKSDFFSGSNVVEFKKVDKAEVSSISSGKEAVSYANGVENAAPAVVNIYTTKVVTRSRHPFFDDPVIQRFFGDSITPPSQKQQNSLGSGVIANDQGYILTNNHVIDGADEILVGLHDGRNVSAIVVGTDPESDLAVLKITLENLPSIVFGHSDTLRVGDVVLAIGNPFGVGQTVTQGIVSATGRNQLGISTFENFIQTDAAINPGNSGGALINPNGELIGINTAIFSRSGGSQGIGFAIPVNLTKNIMKEIIEHGHAVRGWLGVEIQTLSKELAESFNIRNMTGIIIAGIVSKGPADEAGLKAGDIITRINDQEITSANEALTLITQTKPGTRIKLHGLRSGGQFSLHAIVSTRPRPNR